MSGIFCCPYYNDKGHLTVEPLKRANLVNLPGVGQVTCTVAQEGRRLPPSIHLATFAIQSLSEFRHVNKKAKLITDSNPQYNIIRTHAPASIRGSLSIGTAQFLSCQALYETLSTAEYDSCGDFGVCLYLITYRRVCFLCFTEKDDFLPLSRKNAIRKLGLDSEHFAKNPCLKSFPGCYSPRRTKYRRREVLTDYSSARQIGIETHGSITSIENHTSEMARKKLEAFDMKRSFHRGHGADLRQPRTEDLFDGRSSNPRRFFGIIRAPFFNLGTSSTEWGSHCIACKSHHYCRPLHWRRKYTVVSFQDHIRECGEIVDEKYITPTS